MFEQGKHHETPRRMVQWPGPTETRGKAENQCSQSDYILLTAGAKLSLLLPFLQTE